MQLQLTIHNNHIHGGIDVCSRLSGKKNHMLVIEMHVIWYAYTCIMQRRTIVVNSHNEKKCNMGYNNQHNPTGTSHLIIIRGGDNNIKKKKIKK